MLFITFTFTVTSDVNEDASMGTNKQQIVFSVKIEPEVLIRSNYTNQTESKIFCVKRKVLSLGYKSVYDICLAFISYAVLLL